MILIRSFLCSRTYSRFREADRYPPLDLTPLEAQREDPQGAVSQVEGFSAIEPVLMVFEDVHWSDPTTRVARPVDRPGAQLRSADGHHLQTEFTTPWVSRPNVTMAWRSVARSRAAGRDGRRLERKALPRKSSDQIINCTDGLPLFIEEVTKSALRVVS